MRGYVSLVKQGNSTLKNRQEMLSEHRARVSKDIDELKKAIKLIDNKIDFYGEWLATGKQPNQPGK